MIRFPPPVVAAVNGPAVGLGCSLALGCDLVLMADDAHLADPHISVGLVAGDGGVTLWPLLTSLLRMKEYLFTGDRIPAATAVQLGLARHKGGAGRGDGAGDPGRHPVSVPAGSVTAAALPPP